MRKSQGWLQCFELKIWGNFDVVWRKGYGIKSSLWVWLRKRRGLSTESWDTSISLRVEDSSQENWEGIANKIEKKTRRVWSSKCFKEGVMNHVKFFWESKMRMESWLGIMEYIMTLTRVVSVNSRDKSLFRVGARKNGSCNRDRKEKHTWKNFVVKESREIEKWLEIYLGSGESFLRWRIDNTC